MKTILIIAMLLLMGCATTRSPESNDKRGATSNTTSAPSVGTSVNNPNRDTSDCEREAALSSAGSKAQAFDNCMRARSNPSKR